MHLEIRTHSVISSFIAAEMFEEYCSIFSEDRHNTRLGSLTKGESQTGMFQYLHRLATDAIPVLQFITPSKET